MLVLALDSEKAAVAQFNASAKECHDLGDHGTAAVFEEMVRDEEKHADWFEAQLGAIERVGRAAVPGRADLHRDALTGSARSAPRAALPIREAALARQRRSADRAARASCLELERRGAAGRCR